MQRRSGRWPAFWMKAKIVCYSPLLCCIYSITRISLVSHPNSRLSKIDEQIKNNINIGDAKMDVCVYLEKLAHQNWDLSYITPSSDNRNYNIHSWMYKKNRIKKRFPENYGEIYNLIESSHAIRLNYQRLFYRADLIYFFFFGYEGKLIGITDWEFSYLNCN